MPDAVRALRAVAFSATFAMGALAAVTALGAVALGCKGKPGPPRATEADAAAAATAAPVDHLAPGELIEGKQKAFALVLPRELKIAREFPGVVHATSSTVRPEQVANYFRRRIQDGTVSSGAAETKFIGVHAQSELTRDLAIEVRPGAPGVTTCEVLIRDVTPPPVEPGLSEDERRKRAGLRPDGKLLDPSRLE